MLHCQMYKIVLTVTKYIVVACLDPAQCDLSVASAFKCFSTFVAMASDKHTKVLVLNPIWISDIYLLG